MATAFDVFPPVVRKRRLTLVSQVVRYRGLFLLLLPSIVWFIIFRYYPMYGVIVAFKDYKLLDGILGSAWVGFQNFERLFRTEYFARVLRNTMIISFQRIALGFPAPILFALLLNEIRRARFKRVIQTISYLPHFISWVVLGGIVQAVLSPTTGVVNWMLDLVGIAPIPFLIRKEFFRPVLILSGIWQSVGWGSIIYLASISGIDPQLYEAAEIDGAGRLRRVISITLPSILPVIVIMFILRIGNFMEAGFEQTINLYNPLVYEVGDIIDTYSYRIGLINFQYSFSTTISLFKNVVGLAFLLTTNAITRRVSEYGVW